MAAGSGLHISISAEPIFQIGGFSITNSIFTTWLVSALILFFSIKFFISIKQVSFDKKPTRLQSFVELVIEGLYNLVKGIAGTNKKARAFFPLVATFFIFIILSNWSGLLPGFGTIGFIQEHEPVVAEVSDKVGVETTKSIGNAGDEQVPVAEVHEEVVSEGAKSSKLEVGGDGVGSFVPYLRGPTADLNTTLALAIISIVSVQFMGLKFLGFKYPTKFINFKGPIQFFVGLLEIISEISKIISFAFRLFGNIFAGEVLLAVIAFLVPLFAPLPFLGLEIFVGFVQALVFAMLTLVFMNIATIGHSEEH